TDHHTPCSVPPFLRIARFLADFPLIPRGPLFAPYVLFPRCPRSCGPHDPALRMRPSASPGKRASPSPKKKRTVIEPTSTSESSRKSARRLRPEERGALCCLLYDVGDVGVLWEPMLHLMLDLIPTSD